MSIEQDWSKMEGQEDPDLSSILQRAGVANYSSHNPLIKIKTALLMNMCWNIFICILYIIVFLSFTIWQVQLAIAIILLVSFWGLYATYREYKQINPTISFSNSVLTELKRNHQSILNWMNLQQRVFLFIYPVCAALGFTLGYFVGSGKPVEAFISKPSFLIMLVIAIAVFVPAGFFLAKWMFKKSLGAHLSLLQKNIKDLEEEH